jgi:H+/Cl- antiporter ClcA
MMHLKCVLGGVAALVLVALIVFALALGAPRAMELLPSGEGGVGVYEIGPWIPLWSVAVVALSVFAAGFYWTFRRVRRRR